uniref:Uncharacterized protein n=1 Tax=Zea mays TaxID=4577 RepID=B4FPD2_MAIZE|nr:unknown [Zea mays]
MVFCKQCRMCLRSSSSQRTSGRTSLSCSWRACGRQTSTTAFTASYGQSWERGITPSTIRLTATTMVTTPSGWTGCLVRSVSQMISSRRPEFVVAVVFLRCWMCLVCSVPSASNPLSLFSALFL